MTKQRIKITSHRNNLVGRLQAHDPATGATVYQVDGPFNGRSIHPYYRRVYRVLGLRSEHPTAHSLVASLAAARETMRLDAARLSRSSR